MKKILFTFISSILISLAIFSCSSTCGSKKCDANDKACCKDKKSCQTEHGKEQGASASGTQDASSSNAAPATPTATSTVTPTVTPTPGKTNKKK
ncbi:MAG: hypothetical protein QE271_13375 [Bacteriovoracaceae bacterium]|nr:hypothetical protein [Bacteriovoracaceae bacterium]